MAETQLSDDPIKEIEMIAPKPVNIDVKNIDWSTAQDALKNGCKKYYHCVKQAIPELVPADLILKKYSYSATIPRTENPYEPTGLGTVLKRMYKTITFQNPTTKKIILDNISLCFPSGSSTIILGPPGCGTTSLLDALGGRNNNGKVEGVCQYGGININHYEWTRFAILCEQLDNHNAILTVRETFEFSKECQNGKDNFYNGLDVDSLFKKDIALKTAITIKSLGLDICEDTIVGDNLKRGISGGERRRVTLGEILVGPQRVILLDKFSTGLDSAVTIDIVRMLKDWAIEMNGIVVAAMLQPDPEVVNLYDNLILLEKGIVTYSGPTKDAAKYFEGMGYKKPKGKDYGSFIAEMGYYSFREDISPGNPIQTLDQMRKHYEESEYCKNMENNINKSLNSSTNILNTPYAKKVYTTVYPKNTWDIFMIVLKRQAKLMIRDRTYLIGRVGQCIVMGIILGLVFGKMKVENPMPRYGSMFFFSMFLIFGNFAQLGSISAQKRVLAKHARNKFFPRFLYIISSILVQYPFILIEVVCLGTPLYWITKLTKSDNSQHFWIFLACGVCMHAAGLTLVRAIVFLCKSEFIALGALAMIIFVLANLCGFTVAKDDISDVFIWIYYINPYTYTMKILATNEFLSSDEKYNVNGDSVIGRVLLKSMGFPTEKDDMYLWFIALIIMHICYLIINIIIVYLTKYTSTISYVVDDENVKKLTDMQRLESLSRVKSRHSALVSETITLSFHNLCYYVNIKNPTTKKKEEKQLLCNINGFIRPNTLTALMGSSGAGKTTLLDVLANQKTSGRITGSILFNGQKLDKVSLTHYLGYVEQGDNLPAKDTVYEALRFSARLRLPNTLTEKQLDQIINDTMELLDLKKYAKMMIGSPGDGLSMAIRKLVMTGIELVANPPIIFLDEPTTGLDSNSALLVVQVLERVAATGKSVICTIHQPSFEIFKLFTDILLLERGGRMIYLGNSGKDGEELVKFLESNPEVPKLEGDVNPASWMLEVTGGGVNIKQVEISKYYEESDLNRKNMEILEEIERNSGGNKLKKLPRLMTPYTRQLKETLLRVSRLYWRTLLLTLPRMLVSIVIGLILGGIYYQKETKTEAGVQAILSSLFISGLFTAIFSCVICLPAMFDQRNVAYRDVDMNLVHPTTYTIAYSLIEIPLAILTSFLVLIIIYGMIGYIWEVEHFFFTWICCFLLILFSTYVGQVLSFVAPTLQVAILGGVGVLSLLNTLSGFLVPYPQLYFFFKMLYWIDAVQYYLVGVCSMQLFCFKGDCKVITTTGVRDVNTFLKEVRGLDYDRRWYSVLAISGFCLLLRIPMTFAISKIRYKTT